MKPRKRKKDVILPLRHRILPWFYAVLVTLPLAVFFFYGFRVSPRDLEPPSTEWEPECIMLEPGETGGHAANNILAWSLIGDPTIMSRPHSELGLSSVNRHSLPNFFEEHPSLKVSFSGLNIDHGDLTAPELAGHPGELGDIQEEWGGLLLKPVRFLQEPVSRKVIWRVNGERLVETSPEVAVEEIQELAEAEGHPEQATELEIIRGRTGPPRFRVRESSGNRKLDHLALQAVQAELFGREQLPKTKAVETDEADEENGGDDEKKTVEMRMPEPGERLRLEVEWRLVLNS